jgi:hypothetical protein
VLFIEPTLQQHTELTRADVPANRLDDLESGHETATLAAAKRYISNLEDEAAPEPPPTTTTTTAVLPPTTVAPPAPTPSQP